jgi:CxxC motif-containing protein
MLEAAAAIRKLKTDRPVRAGEVIAENLLGLGADLVATRDVPADTP